MLTQDYPEMAAAQDAERAAREAAWRKAEGLQDGPGLSVEEGGEEVMEEETKSKKHASKA